MLMGHNVPTNRLGLYFALQLRLTSLSLLSKMLVKFCVKIGHNYSCTEISNELTLRSYLLIPPNRKTFLFDNSETDSDVMPRILWNLRVRLVEKNMPQNLLNKKKQRPRRGTLGKEDKIRRIVEKRKLHRRNTYKNVNRIFHLKYISVNWEYAKNVNVTHSLPPILSSLFFAILRKAMPSPCSASLLFS